MAKIIELPKLSPTMEEGTLVRWAKNEGDAVAIDDLLAEVETDKATMEFRAFDRGTLLKRLISEGATAKLGQPVAIFGDPGEDVSALVPSSPRAAEKTPEPAAEKPAPAASREAVAERAPAPAVVAPDPAPAPSGPAPAALLGERGVPGIILAPRSRPGQQTTRHQPTAAGGTGVASPRVRRLARERGIALDVVRGTGPHGRVTVDDLERGAPTTTTGEARAEDTSKPASQMRKAIARRLTEAKRDVPHFYLEADLDVEALVALREQLNDGMEKESRVSVNDFFIRACALALREVPTSNASWVDGNIVQHHRVDVSVAVAIEDGLVTPVVRDVDTKSLRTIASEVRELAARARAKKLRLEEMQGGVFSLSNLGMFGVDRFAAVINPPEGMILAVGATRSVPVVRDDRVVPGIQCAVTLSCDHRIVDGALGAQFLKALRALVEHPVRILA